MFCSNHASTFSMCYNVFNMPYWYKLDQVIIPLYLGHVLYFLDKMVLKFIFGYVSHAANHEYHNTSTSAMGSIISILKFIQAV